MSEYVSRILLEINSQNIEDFDSVEEKEVELSRPVKLMNKTGHTTMTPRYGVSVDYVIPADGPEFDFTTVQGGTLTIDRQNGQRITYNGLWTTKIGNLKYDGSSDGAAKRTIEFSAEDKTEE